jgi:hypothetical protein
MEGDTRVWGAEKLAKERRALGSEYAIQSDGELSCTAASEGERDVQTVTLPLQGPLAVI